MMKTKKKTTKVFKLFQKNKQAPSSKKEKHDAALDEDGGILAHQTEGKSPTRGSAPETPQKPRSATPGKKSKKGRWFGIRKQSKKSQSQQSQSHQSQNEPHNETFMTAETELTNEEKELKQTTLELFPDLRDGALPPELSRLSATNMESWKDFVCDDANPEGVEVSKDSSYKNTDNSLLAMDFNASDDPFSALDMGPIGVFDVAKTSPGAAPNMVGFESQIRDTPRTPFEAVDAPFFPDFPAFDEVTEIVGFLSPDQETKLGTPTRIPGRSKPSADYNPAALALQSLAVTLDALDNVDGHATGTADDAASHGYIIERNHTDVSSLDGSRFADGDVEDPEEPEVRQVHRFAYAEDFVEEQEDEVEEEQVPMEPSIEAQIAMPSLASFSVASESQAGSVNFPLPLLEPSETPDEGLDTHLDSGYVSPCEASTGSAQLRSQPPPPPPPPPPRSPKKYMPSVARSTLLDDQNKVVDLCETSVSSVAATETSGSSIKTENNLLHHHKMAASPHSWSAVKSGSQRVLQSEYQAEATHEPLNSYLTDNLSEVSLKDEQKNRTASIYDELDHRSQEYDAQLHYLDNDSELHYLDNTSVPPASSTGYEAAASFSLDEARIGSTSELGEDDNDSLQEMIRELSAASAGTDRSYSLAQEQGDWEAEKVQESEKDEPFDVTASMAKSSSQKDKEASKSQGNKKSRLVKRALNLATGGSQLQVIPEQTAYSDSIAPVRHNYRKLCTKFIQHAITDRRTKQRALAKIDQICSVTDDESSAQENSVLSLDETPMSPESDANDNGSEGKPDYLKLSTEIVQQHMSERNGRLTSPERLPKQVHFISDYVSCEEDGGQLDGGMQEEAQTSNPAMQYLALGFEGSPTKINKYTDKGRFQTEEEDEDQEDNSHRDAEFVVEDVANEEAEDDAIGEIQNEIENGPSFEAALAADDDAETFESELADLSNKFNGSPDEQIMSDTEESLTDFYKQRAKAMANSRRKGKNSRKEKTETEFDVKIPGLAFLTNIAALDRFAGNLDCSFFSANENDHEGESGDEYENDFGGLLEDDESILTYDDEGTFGSFDSSREGPLPSLGGRLGIEAEVEEALKWADEHMLMCGQEDR